jgi:RNA polymerase sigma-70 factor, ECF subfamily
MENHMQPAIHEANPAPALPTQRASLRPVHWQAMSAEELVQHCRLGEPAAIGTLIDRYERRIYNQAYHLTRNYHNAHEIAAEAYLRVYRAISTLDSAASLAAWIDRIVVNVYVDMQRRAHRHPWVSLEHLVEEEGAEAAFTADGSSLVSPQSHAEEAERKQLLGSAIASLPGYQRTVVDLFHTEGHTYDEIAGMMGMPVGTVKSRLHRARLALRIRLEPERTVFAD